MEVRLVLQVMNLWLLFLLTAPPPPSLNLKMVESACQNYDDHQAGREPLPPNPGTNQKNSCRHGRCLCSCAADAMQPSRGFISIDCGADGDYYDDESGLNYNSDSQLITTGKIRKISPAYYNKSQFLARQLKTLRSFPKGKRNCYTLQLPDQGGGRNHIYEIRAFFKYGDYDRKCQLPIFDIYLGSRRWATVHFKNSSSVVIRNIVLVSLTDKIHVCLVNTGKGKPFISALELRPLSDTFYGLSPGQLAIVRRYDLGNPADEVRRYKDDVYDRLWLPYYAPHWDSIKSSKAKFESSNNYRLPAEVLTTAAKPKSGRSFLNFTFRCQGGLDLYLHFADIERKAANDSRERNLTIAVNGAHYETIKLEYLKPISLFIHDSCPSELQFSINSTGASALPPLLNAFEILMHYKHLIPPTDPVDVDAIEGIMETYNIERHDWRQGDPCLPDQFPWSGLKCSNGTDNISPRIISLNLSSSNLKGEIASCLCKLTALQSLDLSYNELTGQIPEIVGQLENLTILNLTGNRLTGDIPPAIMEKYRNGTLKLSLEGNPNECEMESCNKRKRILPMPIMGSVTFVVVLVLLSIIVILWRRTQKGETVAELPRDSSVNLRNRSFTYSKIVTITNNLRNIIGEGGFGKVYLGNIDGTHVAVKLLSQFSRQGRKEFEAEVRLLMIVHHRNLVSLIGYCDEGENRALVYEYMPNGNLLQHLGGAGAGTNVLTWKMRLQIAIDAAHGLEYLHNGCRPPIIHRDLKTTNILMNEKMQAKISDFGLSIAFPTDRVSHVTTRPAGTPGYLDPEFRSSGSLNKKSDIYSFGVILLELVTGLPAVIRGHDYSTHIVQWVTPLIEQQDIHPIVDPRLQGEFNDAAAWRAVEIAMSCVPPTARQRPDVSHVLAGLKECLATELAAQSRGSPGASNTMEVTSPSPR